MVDRAATRRRLLEERERFAASAEAATGAASLARQLCEVLRQLEPALLGLYWPRRSEFNAAAAIVDDFSLARSAFALPFARKSPTRMDYRAWDGRAPPLPDECGIPSSDGPVVIPDVVVVPCVGFSADGHRLGYGGGYFDRWLALHPETTAIGVAWSFLQVAADEFQPLGHDQPMTLIVTEKSVS